MSIDSERPRLDSSVEVWIYEAKNLKLKKWYFCELYVDNILFGRTSRRKNIDVLFWGDWFRFNPVDNWEEIRIELYSDTHRKRNHSSRELVGALRLYAEQLSRFGSVGDGCFRHPGGEYCDREDWYIMEQSALKVTDKSQSNPINIRVKVRYERLYILPIYFYDHLRLYIQHKYSLLISTLESSISLKNKDDLASSLVNIAYYHGFWMSFLCDVISDEIANLKDSSLTFRGTSIATKSIEAFMRMGVSIIVHLTLHRHSLTELLVKDKYSGDLEVDPSRIEDTFTLRANRQRLIGVCDIIWKTIRTSYHLFPHNLKFLFAALRDKCRQYHGDNDQLIDNLISSCVFLRFICPALLAPNLFGLTCKYPDGKNARKLTLIAKTLQTLANFSKFGNKEPFMKCMNVFVEREFHNMRSFIRSISCYSDICGANGPHCKRRKTPPIVFSSVTTKRPSLRDDTFQSSIPTPQSEPLIIKHLPISNGVTAQAMANGDIRQPWIDIGRQFSFVSTLLSTIAYRQSTLEIRQLDDLRSILDQIKRFHVMECLINPQTSDRDLTEHKSSCDETSDSSSSFIANSCAHHENYGQGVSGQSGHNPKIFPKSSGTKNHSSNIICCLHSLGA
ncbi:hypothetical protein ACOME3_009621 [Neoechinorhynchus agilis]